MENPAPEQIERTWQQWLQAHKQWQGIYTTFKPRKAEYDRLFDAGIKDQNEGQVLSSLLLAMQEIDRVIEFYEKVLEFDKIPYTQN